MTTREEFYEAMKGPLVGRTMDNWDTNVEAPETVMIDGNTYALRNRNLNPISTVYDRYDFDEDNPDRTELIVINAEGLIIAQWETADDGAVGAP